MGAAPLNLAGNLPSPQEVDAARAAVDTLRGFDLHGQPTPDQPRNWPSPARAMPLI